MRRMYIVVVAFMGYSRLHIRVPVAGEVMLSSGETVHINARVIDISAVGMRIASPEDAVQPGVEYQVHIQTESHAAVEFKAQMVHEGEYGIGCRITEIDSPNLRVIYQMVTDFQGTEAFIDQIERSNILEDWFTDENGETLNVVFEEK